MHHHTKYSTEAFPSRTESVNPTEQHDTASARKTIHTTLIREKMTTIILQQSDSTSSTNKGVSKGVIISSSIVALLGVVAILVVAVVFVRFWKTKMKRRTNIRTVRSNTQLSFDNLSYVGEGRRESVYHEVDMTDFEIMRSRVVTSIKRKVSAFSAKSKEQNSCEISCGRLSIVETNYENSTLDLGEIVQTFQV